MNERQLTSFVTVVEWGSFTAAAEALYVSQSALFQQVIQLERQLGFSLFDRHNRQASLTDSGKAFYSKARQILALCHAAGEEGRYLQKLTEKKKQRLRVACLGEQFVQIWMGLFWLSREILDGYMPVAVRYSSREKLFEALRQGEADISVMLENCEIDRYRLISVPFARTEELCYFPAGMNESFFEAGKPLRPEDLADFAIAFHNEPGVCSYEDALREYLADRLPNTQRMNPVDFFSASYAPTVLLMPAILHTPHLKSCVNPLNWRGGARVCFVISPKCDNRAIKYAEYIKEHISAETCPWYLPLKTE